MNKNIILIGILVIIIIIIGVAIFGRKSSVAPISQPVSISRDLIFGADEADKRQQALRMIREEIVAKNNDSISSESLNKIIAGLSRPEIKKLQVEVAQDPEIQRATTPQERLTVGQQLNNLTTPTFGPLLNSIPLFQPRPIDDYNLDLLSPQPTTTPNNRGGNNFYDGRELTGERVGDQLGEKSEKDFFTTLFDMLPKIKIPSLKSIFNPANPWEIQEIEITCIIWRAGAMKDKDKEDKIAKFWEEHGFLPPACIGAENAERKQ